MISNQDIEKLKDCAPFLSKAFAESLREIKLASYIETIERFVSISKTQATVHFHCIALDGNGRPRVNDLIRKICSHVIDYAIPRSKFADAVKKFHDTKSSSDILRLEKEAKSLFSGIEKTGEGGELLLSLLTEYFLGFPQIIAKMPLKTNPNVHYHGSDGIHASVDEKTEKLTLYWGESKLHKNISSAIKDCFKSLAPFLLDAGGSDATQERDLQLLRDGLDLNNDNLESALKQYLDPDHPLFKELEYRGLCLVGFDSVAYPNIPNSKTVTILVDEIKKELDEWKSKLAEGIIGEKIDTFTIEVFCVPFPSVDDFRKLFLKEMGLA